MRSDLRLAGAVAPTQPARSKAPASPAIVCRRVHSTAERADHLAARQQVFVDEQAIFPGSDADSHDQDESTIVLLGYWHGVVAGTVRLFVLDPAAGLWQGDRLVVLPPYRSCGLGAPLVRCAVGTAAALGGRRMTAHIQPAQVAFFRRLGWAETRGTEIYAGLIHQPMGIALPTQEQGTATVRRLAGGISARDLSRH